MTSVPEPSEHRVLEILDEYISAVEAGNAPDEKELLARHPEIAGSLSSALLGLAFVRRGAQALGNGSDDGSGPGAVGQVLGDYRLLREIGRGGMAVVYEAEQISLGRRVALKVLPFAAVLDPKQLQRFKNEAMAAAHLRHPSIVPVYAVGCERGVHYYAMQYVEGQSLAHAIGNMKRGGAGEGARTPISSHGSNREPAYVRMAATLGAQAAEALDHAHQLGVVHRDVKPGNLLVDHAGALWVTDFGLASSVADVGLTVTGEILGTIRYMSPEQALAKRVPIDHRTDVYSLGATLYELFALEPAFPGDDPHAIMQDIAFRDPVPPRKLNPALPVDLETVLLKAMSKDPAARYATAQEMADDLKRFLVDRPVEAKRPGLPRRAAKWGRRHRALVGAAAAFLLLGITGLAAGTSLLWREKQRTDAALARAESNLDLALMALDRIYVDEAEGHPKIREGLPRDLLETGLQFYEDLARTNVGNPDVVRLAGNAYHTASLIFRELDQEGRAEEALDRAISAYRECTRRWPEDSRPHSNLGLALTDKGDFDGAVQECREAIRLRPDNPNAHYNLGRALGAKGDVEGAIREFRQVTRLKPDDVRAHANLGAALSDSGDLEGAIREHREAIRLEPLNALAHHNLGISLMRHGDAKGAIDSYREAIRLRPGDTVAHFNLGWVLYGTGDVEGAVGEYRELIRLITAAGGRRKPQQIPRWDDHLPTLAQAHSALGEVLESLGRADEALQECDRAIELDPKDARAHITRGSVLHDRCPEREEALEEFDEAIRLDPTSALAHGLRGIALDSLDRPADAAAAYGRAIELSPRAATFHEYRAKALYKMGWRDQALAAVEGAIAIDPRSASAHAVRGVVLHDCFSRFEEALKEFDLAIELSPKDANSHFNRGNALKSLGRLEQALEAYTRATELAPGQFDAHLRRGAILALLGRPSASLEAYDRAFDLGYRDPEALNNAAWLRATSADPQLRSPTRAVWLAREAVTQAPEDGSYWNTLGVASCGAGAWQEALDALAKSMEARAGGDAYDWFFVAIAHSRLDHKEEARRSYEKAVAWTDANKPGDEELQRFRDEAAAVLGLR